MAARLTGEAGAALLEAARETFTLGLQLTAGLSAAVAVGVAVMATVLLRAVPAGSEPDQQPATPTEPVAATPPEPQPQPEPAIQVIRVDSGCLACPGERSFSQLLAGRWRAVGGGDTEPRHHGRRKAARRLPDGRPGAARRGSSADLATFVSVLDHVLDRLRGAPAASPAAPDVSGRSPSG